MTEVSISSLGQFAVAAHRQAKAGGPTKLRASLGQWRVQTVLCEQKPCCTSTERDRKVSPPQLDGNESATYDSHQTQEWVHHVWSLRDHSPESLQEIVDPF
jgi:hypothetical protein